MKGLLFIPTLEDFEKAYTNLVTEVTTDQLVLYSQWTRFDPRLGEIWVKTFSATWKKLNPIEMHEKIKQQPWPQAVGVLLEFVSKTIPKNERSLFSSWKKLVLAQIHPAHFEQYFIGLRKLGGKLMLEDATYSVKEYVKWGYLSREILFNKAAELPFSTHSLDYETRKKIAEKLISELPRIYTTDYWNAVKRSISRRQAERDLLQFSFLRPYGKTKSRVFVKKS